MSALGTADPNSACAHARAQAGTRAEAMPTVPDSAAEGLDPDIDPAALVWDETVAAGGYAGDRPGYLGIAAHVPESGALPLCVQACAEEDAAEAWHPCRCVGRAFAEGKADGD